MATLQFTEGSSKPPGCVATTGQLLPNVVDGLAQTRPESLYAIIPKSFTSYDDGFRKISYRELANAINGAAHLVSNELSSITASQVLAYVGPNDIGYIAFILGAVKRTSCSTLLTTPPPYSPTIANIVDDIEEAPRIIHIPTIFQLLETQHLHFPYPKTFDAAKDEILALLHTSGTTSTPKLVTYTHGFAAAHNRWSSQPPPQGYINLINLLSGQRAFANFPFFYSGGIQVALMNSIMNQKVIVTCLAAVPPSAPGIVDALKHVDLETVHMVAPFMEQMAKPPEMLDSVLLRVRNVTYGGADVSEAAATAFLAKVQVVGFNGSTESAPYPLIRPKEGCTAADVKYIQPHPIANLQFQPTGMPDLFEGVIIRNKEVEHTQTVFHIFPKLQEFRTKDLFSPHPERPGLWLYRSRADDMIVSAAGEMCNPVPFEQAVARLPQVAAVLMIGTGRYQKALLVEPADDESHLNDDFLESIWPTIEAMNQSYPQVNQITRDQIMLTEPGNPLRRAGKGTVQRAPSLGVYKEQIDRLYESAGDGDGQHAEPYKVHISASNLEKLQSQQTKV